MLCTKNFNGIKFGHYNKSCIQKIQRLIMVKKYRNVRKGVKSLKKKDRWSLSGQPSVLLIFQDIPFIIISKT